MEKKEWKLTNFLFQLFGLLWLGSWFATIWVDGYRLQLFFSGIFFLFLASVMRNLLKEIT